MISTLSSIKYFYKKLILLINNYNNLYRANIIDLSMDFVRHNHIEGNYCEFGVFKGKTFQYAYHSAQLKQLTDTLFFAFDSFEGFSKPKGNDNIGLLKKGGRSCSEKEFTKNLSHWQVDLSKVKIIKGWFSQTLEGKGKDITEYLINNPKIAIVYLDADLYEPTISALNFITDRLVDGSVLIFDNWNLFKGSPFRGEQKAFFEWSKNNPQFHFSEFYKFGWHGNSFIINYKI